MVVGFGGWLLGYKKIVLWERIVIEGKRRWVCWYIYRLDLNSYEISNRGLHGSNKSMGVRRAEGWSVSVDDRSGADEF